MFASGMEALAFCDALSMGAGCPDVAAAVLGHHGAGFSFDRKAGKRDTQRVHLGGRNG